jgi:hypothetical protein
LSSIVEKQEAMGTQRTGGGLPWLNPALLFCGLSLTLSCITEVAALLSPRIVEEEELGG